MYNKYYSVLFVEPYEQVFSLLLNSVVEVRWAWQDLRPLAHGTLA